MFKTKHDMKFPFSFGIFDSSNEINGDILNEGR
jgi:hypothetical protein